MHNATEWLSQPRQKQLFRDNGKWHIKIGVIYPRIINQRNQNQIENERHQAQSENTKHQKRRKPYKPAGCLFLIFFANATRNRLHAVVIAKRNACKIHAAQTTNDTWNNNQTDSHQRKLNGTGKRQKSEKAFTHHLLEALGSCVAREARVQNEPRSAKLLRPREPKKHKKNAKTESSQQGFQDRRRAQNENWRPQNQIENERRQAQSENTKHQKHRKHYKPAGCLFLIFLPMQQAIVYTPW